MAEFLDRCVFYHMENYTSCSPDLTVFSQAALVDLTALEMLKHQIGLAGTVLVHQEVI